MSASWKSLDSCYLLDIAPDLPRLTPEQEYQLGMGGENKSQEDIDTLVLHNISLVAHIAYRYAAPTYPVQDALQDGMIGLHKAAVGFSNKGADLKQYGRGPKFSGYAHRAIEQSIFRGKIKSSEAVRRPEHLHRIRKLMSEYERVSGLDPLRATAKDIRRVLNKNPSGLTEQTLQNCKEYVKRDVSVDAPLGDDQNTTLLGTLESGESLADVNLERLEARQAVADAVQNLPERLQRVMFLRYFDEEGALLRFSDDFQAIRSDMTSSLDAIGDELGVSRERARQLVNQAFDMMVESSPHLAEYIY